MKFADLSIKQDWITHTLENGLSFQEKTYLTFEEEVEIIVGVINVVTANTIIDGVINDKRLVDKYLIVFYTLIATDIEFTLEEIDDAKNIMEVLTSNKINEIYYNNPNYTYLYDWIIDLLKIAQKYNTTFSGTVSKLINDLPKQLEGLLEMLEDEEVVNKINKTLNNLNKDEVLKLN